MFIIQKFRLIFTFVRYKPFFPFQTLQGFEDDDEEYIHIQQWALTEGRLKVTLLECSRYVLCYYYIRGKKVYRKCMWAVFVLVPLCVNLYYIICKFFNGKFHKSSPFQLIKNINYIYFVHIFYCNKLCLINLPKFTHVSVNVFWEWTRVKVRWS